MIRVVALFVFFLGASWLAAQEEKRMKVFYTENPPIIDGLRGDNWGNTESDWTVLRSAENDNTNNRFSAVWDDAGFYLMHEVNYDGWAQDGIFGINLNYENLQLFFDPNTDGETNGQTGPEDTGIDGYQLIMNQPLGESEFSLSRITAGIATEAHVNARSGDQGQPWSGFRGMQMQQRTSVEENSGYLELFIPWNNFDATNPDFGFDPTFGDDIGLYHPEMPSLGEEWFFNIGRVQSDGTTSAWMVDDPNNSFLSVRPHGILQFVEDEGSGVTPTCDINQNRVCDADDIDILSDIVRTENQDPIYDLNHDDLVGEADRVAWVKAKEYMHTWFGDANLDGEFGSADLVDVFVIGNYEDQIPENSGWASGDWDGDREFSTSDLVLAFQDGGYELGPRAGVQTVPEPNVFSWWLMSIGALLFRRIFQCN